MQNWIILIAILLAIWWFSTKNNVKNNASNKEIARDKDGQIKEETIFKIEENFEEKLLDEAHLPDAVGGKEIYIFRKLMRPWFNELSSKNRYNDEMIQKLRNDWIDYMEALEDASTYNFLSLESEEKAEDIYRDKHIAAAKKVFAIEKGFAAAMGKSATKELARIRELSPFLFTEKGDFTPDGITS